MTHLVEVDRIGTVERILLNRPDVFNSFDLDLIGEFAEHLTTTAKDDSVRAVVISGNGKAFCAGGDLKWMLEYPAGPEAAIHRLAAGFHRAIIEIRRMEKPVIAAIGGIAAGGGFSLALSCDFRLMEKSATVKFAYTSAGLTMDGGASFMLPRIVGLARAMEITVFDEPISSERAERWGLVTAVVEDGHALDEGVKLADRLTRGPLFAFGRSKRLLTNSFETAFEAQLEREREGIEACGGHPEGREGLTAFLEKRKPKFEN
jgi:2-(1,2-epoxy-1,2-dihydrophenyl)acetyl-CoA isomerase